MNWNHLTGPLKYALVLFIKKQQTRSIFGIIKYNLKWNIYRMLCVIELQNKNNSIPSIIIILIITSNKFNDEC